MPPKNLMTKPTTDSRHEHATDKKLKSSEEVKPEPIADPEPKGAMSDQMCEPATISNKEHSPEAKFVPKLEPEEESD